jgi:hypothetical protein
MIISNSFLRRHSRLLFETKVNVKELNVNLNQTNSILKSWNWSKNQSNLNNWKMPFVNKKLFSDQIKPITSKTISTNKEKPKTIENDKSSESTGFINVIFVDKTGNKIPVKAPLGMNMLEVAHKNDIDLEGYLFYFILYLLKCGIKEILCILLENSS